MPQRELWWRGSAALGCGTACYDGQVVVIIRRSWTMNRKCIGTAACPLYHYEVCELQQVHLVASHASGRTYDLYVGHRCMQGAVL